MGKGNNAARMVGVRQIERSRELALGAPKKDIDKYGKVVSEFGNVAPAIVAAAGGMYSLIDGHARVEACARAGISEMPVVVAQAGGEEDKAKLSLLLSSSREQGGYLSEGAMIEKLVEDHGLTLGELSAFVGRSKSWLSKRQTTARNLSPPLAGMVLSGAVCARAAEEIAKLPRAEQALFAANIARDGLSKDEVCRLVRLYRSPDATLEMCRAIVETPAGALAACPKTGKARKARAAAPAGSRMCGAAHMAMAILDGIWEMAAEQDGAAFEAARAHLLELRRKMLALAMLIASRADPGVSPGKQEGGGHD